MARTDTLGNFLTDVATAIREKKGTTDTIQASNFDTEIASIEGASKYAPRHICFSGYTGEDLTEEIENLDVSKVTDMGSMFSGCQFLISLDLSEWNTSNVTSMPSMFNNCLRLNTAYISNFDTSKVTNMSNMFGNCRVLNNLDLSKWNTSNVTSMTAMFSNCYNITTLDLSNFDFSKLTSTSSLFSNCRALTKLDIRTFDFTNITSSSSMFYNVPTSCEIIVKDDTAKAWINTNFSTMTNVKTVAEYEAQ